MSNVAGRLQCISGSIRLSFQSVWKLRNFRYTGLKNYKEIFQVKEKSFY